mmetsp:Transcript_17163/g.16489  ORF Transcript_17163/g.16489 Transcript_17163/m.16489 type:complete len:339 (+) Transcript_17163:54-1070(+)
MIGSHIVLLSLSLLFWTSSSFITPSSRLQTNSNFKNCLSLYSNSRSSKIQEFVGDYEQVISNEIDDEKELAAIAASEEMLFNKAENSDLKSPIDEQYSETIAKEGVVRINNVIPKESAKQLSNFIMNELEVSKLDVKNGKIETIERFSNMLSSNNRWDLKLPMNSLVTDTLKALFSSDGAFKKLLTSLVTEDGELFELAAFYTLSGAGRQVLHADTLFSSKPALYTCAIALQDISEDMGPTLFIPGSHTKMIQKKFDSKKTKDEVLLNYPHELSTLNTGDVSIYDSRVLHCGTPNRSNKKRILIYVTFRNPSKKDSDFWNVASIRPEYKGKFRVRDFF